MRASLPRLLSPHRRARVLTTPLLLTLLLALGACASASRPATDVARAPERVAALPAVPAVDGPLEVTLTWPREGALRPDVDSSFVFGTVGTGRAVLHINGTRVPVAANGAFLAFLPVPRDGRYRLEATAGGARDVLGFAYAAPPPPAPTVTAFETPLLGRIREGRDTLATGSVVVHAAPTPGGDRRWFFPIGARLHVTGRDGDHLRVQLTPQTEAWVAAASVDLTDYAAPPAEEAVGLVTLASTAGHLDVRLPARHAPFLVAPDDDGVTLTVYGRTASATPALPADDAWVEAVRWQGAPADSAVLRLELAQHVWGYKAFYDDGGELVVRLRRPPAIDAADPLRGVRVLVDAGHPPGGAVGPTGFTEAEANLAVSLRLAELLRARGADVLLSRHSDAAMVSETSVATELWARVDSAVAWNAELLVSVHNNAFPEGVNPFEHYGTEVYYFHPFAAGLAEALVQELAAVTGLPNLGAKQRSLALVRPSWMPAVLTESLFMMFPQQEAALRDPAFVDRLAVAHLRGLEAFLRSRAATP